jgi:hypothetical protein
VKVNSSALLATFASLIFLLTGCGSFPKQQFFVQAHDSPIKKIAIVRAPGPYDLGVINMGGAGWAFGLIGAGIEAGIRADRTKEFTLKMTEQKFAAGEHLTRTLEAELRNQGFDVVIVDRYPIAVDGSNFEYDYSRVTTTADAILHAWFLEAAYISPANSAYFIPHVSILARLVSAKDNRQLYFKALMHGVNFHIENVEHIAPSGGYELGDYDMIVAKPSVAAEGLKNGIWAIGARIGKDLGDNPSLYEKNRELEDEQHELDTQKRVLDAQKRVLDAQQAAEAAKIERVEHWKTWITEHPGDPCGPALVKLTSAPECAGAACNTTLALAVGYLRDCKPDPETRILVHKLRRKWEGEVPGTTSN